MRKAVKAIAAASALIVALATAPGSLAQGLPGIGFNWTGNLAMPRGMMPGQGMMGRMMQGQGMMGGSMQGESIGQMDQMMEDCEKMMRERDGSRDRGNQPQQPERRG